MVATGDKLASGDANFFVTDCLNHRIDVNKTFEELRQDPAVKVRGL